MVRSQTLTVARAAPIQFLAHWLFTPRRDTLRRLIKIANSGVVNFISWHRAEFRPACGRSISSSGGRLLRVLDLTCGSLPKQQSRRRGRVPAALPSSPLRAAWGKIVGLSKDGVPPLRLFYGGKMQNCRRRVARLGSAPRSVTFWLQT